MNKLQILGKPAPGTILPGSGSAAGRCGSPAMIIAGVRLARYVIAAGVLLILLNHAQAWEKLPAQLIENRWNDGDSFHVSAGGQERVIRLYGVDCAETDDDFPARVEEQRLAFGLADVAATLAWGKRAEEVTHALLSRPFTIFTRWEDALGRSALGRHYAYVILEDGRDLGRFLLHEKLARRKGFDPLGSYPTGSFP